MTLEGTCRSNISAGYMQQVHELTEQTHAATAPIHSINSTINKVQMIFR